MESYCFGLLLFQEFFILTQFKTNRRGLNCALPHQSVIHQCQPSVSKLQSNDQKFLDIMEPKPEPLQKQLTLLCSNIMLSQCHAMDMLQPVSSLYHYNESSRFLQHVSTDLPDYVVPKTKRQQSKHFANGIYFKMPQRAFLKLPINCHKVYLQLIASNRVYGYNT